MSALQSACSQCHCWDIVLYIVMGSSTDKLDPGCFSIADGHLLHDVQGRREEAVLQVPASDVESSKGETLLLASELVIGEEGMEVLPCLLK